MVSWFPAVPRPLIYRAPNRQYQIESERTTQAGGNISSVWAVTIDKYSESIFG